MNPTFYSHDATDFPFRFDYLQFYFSFCSFISHTKINVVSSFKNLVLDILAIHEIGILLSTSIFFSQQFAEFFAHFYWFHRKKLHPLDIFHKFTLVFNKNFTWISICFDFFCVAAFRRKGK